MNHCFLGAIANMPTYEYKCDECGIVFERFQHFSADPLKTCPECGGSVHRVIHPVGVIFKGKGFYVTDNKGKSSTLPVTEDKESEAKPEPSATETKSAEPAKATESAGSSEA